MEFNRIEESSTDVKRRLQVPFKINQFALLHRTALDVPYNQKPTVVHILLTLMEEGMRIYEYGEVVEFKRQPPPSESDPNRVLPIPLEFYNKMEGIAEKIKTGQIPKTDKYVVSLLDVILCLIQSGYNAATMQAVSA